MVGPLRSAGTLRCTQDWVGSIARGAFEKFTMSLYSAERTARFGS
ncbi:Uncharacterised protein [Mycobacterium tuberculosis]|nr:Uncharacterised protein [Mycobacterium tuberculosis]